MTELEYAVALQTVAVREHEAWRQARMLDNDRSTPSAARGNAQPPRYTWRDYEACARKGMTRKQTAKHLGVAERAVVYMVRKYRIKFRDARRKSIE